MPSEYPYMVSNNKIKPILDSIRSAAKPTKFTNNFIRSLGYTSSNDRAIIPLLKKLGFITENGFSTEYYDRLKDDNDYQYVLGERIKDLYSDLFTINENIYNTSDKEIKGAISRVTGKDSTTVNRYFLTFKILSSLAKFQPRKIDKEKRKPEKEPEKIGLGKDIVMAKPFEPQFHYNIQIHLPATTDISVYNAIFQSLKENLLV